MGSEAEAETPWRHLHPLSLLVNLVPQAWGTIRSAWLFILAILLGGDEFGAPAADLSILFVFFGMTLVRTVIHFATLRYRVHAGRFEVQVGLLNRNARALDPKRIQNIEVVQNLFHKMAGLVELRVETAGDGSTHGLLSALSVGEAGRLRAELEGLVQLSRGTGSDVAAGPVAAAEALVSGGALELLGYGLSRRTMGTVAVLTAIGFELMGQLGPEFAAKAGQVMRPEVAAPAVVLAFVGSFFWSAGTALFRHWGFVIWQEGRRLISEEGLTTRRRVEIPIEKVQVLRADEPFLRRTMGYATVLLETAALGFADGRIRQAEGIVPMVPRERLAELVAAALPKAEVDPWETPLKPAHPRALYRAMIARTLRALVLAGLLTAAVPRWGWLGFLLVPWGWISTWMDWRWQGWLVTPTAVVTRRGFMERSTWIISRDKIQNVEVHQGPLMRWHGLGLVRVSVAGFAVALPVIGFEEALGVLEQLRAVPMAVPPGGVTLPRPRPEGAGEPE